MSNNNLSTKQKKFYIKRHIDNEIIDLDTIKNIYKIVKNDNNTEAIRDSNNGPGIFIDLNKVSSTTIDKIYNIIKKHLDTISIN